MSKTFTEVFQRDNRRCVYCGRDLMTDFESFMLSQEDHLIPRRSGGSDDLDNLVIACFVCNMLRGSFMPEIEFNKKTRTKYIDAIRDHIMNARSRNMRNFASWTHEEKDNPPQPPQLLR